MEDKEKKDIVEAGYGKEIVDKYYKYMKNNMPIDTFMEKFHMNEIELRGLMELAKLYGKKISIQEKDGYMVFKKNQSYNNNIYTKAGPDDDSLIETEILVVGDTHFGNNKQQMHLLNWFYQEAYNRGIDTVLHLGDMVDGNYLKIRPENGRLLFLHDFDQQAGYVADMYPEVDGMKTYYILGSHDETHYKNGGATLNNFLDRCRKDMIYLGQDTGSIVINGVKYLLDHPGGGSSQSVSYKAQKRIEILESKHKPKVMLIGHYHKSYTFLYRNVFCVQNPALCATTQFQQKQGLLNYVGAHFIKVYSDKNGNIQYFEPEEILFSGKDIWDEAGKDKNKVKKLEIKKGVY